MPDEPYSFGPTDPRAQDVGPVGAEPRTDDQAWASLPTTEHPAAFPPAGEPAPWGAQPPVEGRRRMSTLAKSLTAAGVAAIIAVGGTVAVTSANADNTTAATSSAGQPMGGEGVGSSGTTGTGRSGRTTGGGGFGGGMASRSLVAGALHGEFVVSDGSGTVTERLQTGVVTSVTATSLALRSTDDFAATYALPSGTDVSSLATGTTVTVIATVNGSTLTVVSISAAGQGGTGSSGTGGFTPPDGAVPGGAGAGSSGSGTGGTGTGSAGTGSGGTGTGGTGAGGGSTGATSEDSGV